MAEPSPIPSPPSPASPGELIGRLEADLLTARKARDRCATTALRTALAAIANAEAPPADLVPEAATGRLVDVPRLQLSFDDVVGILRAEIADRHDTIERLAGHGQDEAVADLSAEIAALERYVG